MYRTLFQPSSEGLPGVTRRFMSRLHADSDAYDLPSQSMVPSAIKSPTIVRPLKLTTRRRGPGTTRPAVMRRISGDCRRAFVLARAASAALSSRALRLSSSRAAASTRFSMSRIAAATCFSRAFSSFTFASTCRTSHCIVCLTTRARCRCSALPVSLGAAGAEPGSSADMPRASDASPAFGFASPVSAAVAVANRLAPARALRRRYHASSVWCAATSHSATRLGIGVARASWQAVSAASS
mmetsp:Transcript_11012/g.38331  ORF Transcript_11012/g.38331 Transcript_11012/m.38331 type:complete len:240 (-) Transcript_11012:586-1305(-)